MTTRRRRWRSPAVAPLVPAKPRKPRIRPPAAQQGYGYPHVKLRAWWKPHVEAGLVDCHAAVCLMPARRIQPGQRWMLGHTADRSAWTGPEHWRCGASDGAIRGNKMRAPQDGNGKPQRRSRIW